MCVSDVSPISLLGALIFSLNTAALPLVVNESSGQVPTDLGTRGEGGKLPPLLFALHLVLCHSSSAVRLSGAWCVRCLSLSLPSQLSSLLTYCMARLGEASGSPTATAGYSFAISSLLGTVRHSELGLPTAKALVRQQLSFLCTPFELLVYTWISKQIENFSKFC